MSLLFETQTDINIPDILSMRGDGRRAVGYPIFQQTFDTLLKSDIPDVPDATQRCSMRGDGRRAVDYPLFQQIFDTLIESDIPDVHDAIQHCSIAELCTVILSADETTSLSLLTSLQRFLPEAFYDPQTAALVVACFEVVHMGRASLAMQLSLHSSLATEIPTILRGQSQTALRVLSDLAILGMTTATDALVAEFDSLTLTSAGCETLQRCISAGVKGVCDQVAAHWEHLLGPHLSSALVTSVVRASPPHCRKVFQEALRDIASPFAPLELLWKELLPVLPTENMVTLVNTLTTFEKIGGSCTLLRWLNSEEGSMYSNTALRLLEHAEGPAKHLLTVFLNTFSGTHLDASCPLKEFLDVWVTASSLKSGGATASNVEAVPATLPMCTGPPIIDGTSTKPLFRGDLDCAQQFTQYKLDKERERQSYLEHMASTTALSQDSVKLSIRGLLQESFRLYDERRKKKMGPRPIFSDDDDDYAFRWGAMAGEVMRDLEASGSKSVLVNLSCMFLFVPGQEAEWYGPHHDSRMQRRERQQKVLSRLAMSTSRK